MIDNSLKTEGDINLSPLRKEWENGLSEKAKEYLKRDADIFIHQTLSTPCLNYIEESNGVFLTDGDGKKLIDFHGNNVHQLGFGNEYILNKVIEQAQKLPFSPRRYTNKAAIECAEKLCKVSGLNRVLFSTSGAIATGIALKLARVATSKHKVISFWDSFHGASLDAVSVGGEAVFRKDMGPLTPGVFHVPPPTSYRGVFYDEHNPDSQDKYADYIEYVIEKEGDIGALIAETIRNTDVQIPTLNFWKRVREICDKHNVLLILDEVPICLGRTGKMFAYENYGILPDILTIGKGLGGGLFPFAAVLAKEELNVAQHKSLGHYTHEKSPLGSAAAFATIEYIEQNNILPKVKELELIIKNKTKDLKNKFDAIGDVRGIGMLWGIELVLNKETKEKDFEGAEKIMYECMRNGLSFKISQGNLLTLSPPLTITIEELDNAFNILQNAFITVYNK